MAELADALDSGSNDRKVVEVQVLLSAPSRSKRHIACSDFFKSQSAFILPLLLFRKRSRPARPLGCKCPCDGSLSLPAFCGLRMFKSLHKKQKNIFFIPNRQRETAIFVIRIAVSCLFFSQMPVFYGLVGIGLFQLQEMYMEEAKTITAAYLESVK